MGLYLGSGQKLKVNINGTKCRLNLIPYAFLVGDIILSSSDNYILTDINGLCITPKSNDSSVITGKISSSSDDY